MRSLSILDRVVLLAEIFAEFDTHFVLHCSDVARYLLRIAFWSPSQVSKHSLACGVECLGRLQDSSDGQVMSKVTLHAVLGM